MMRSAYAPSEIAALAMTYRAILFENPAAPHGYTQLSDFIENDTASEEQKRAFEIISQIQTGIIEHNDFMYGENAYHTTTCDSIEFSRLYTFLSDIDAGNFSKYPL